MADRRVHGEAGQDFWKRESEQKYKARIKTSLQGREARIFSVGTEELAALVFDLTGHGKGFETLRRSPVVGAEGRESRPLSGWKQKALRRGVTMERRGQRNMAGSICR